MVSAPQSLELVLCNYVSQNQENGGRSNTISLGVLIDFIVQRTYNDLMVLADVLPRKTDMERKVEVYNFASRTRQLFIRLIALVKWANSVSKVDKSANIMSFLDNQNMLFVETADMLARISRETLVRARLPNYHMAAAIDVMTTGTYKRLPTCIRQRIIPPSPITTQEKLETLTRLNQIIQHRLVTGRLLPQMKSFTIQKGRVTFEVNNEFNISLTVMGDNPRIPWRILHIEILVEDKETGDGKSLVHPLQVNYIHQLIQARIIESEKPLEEIYKCLHFFCQSLQLELLYTQTLRLRRDRLGDNVSIEEYVPGVRVVVSYWREYVNADPKSEFCYRIAIQADKNGLNKSLTVLHVPSLSRRDSMDVTNRIMCADQLSMERLIVHTIYIRSLSRLSDLKADFQELLNDSDVINLQGTPAILTVPVLTPCLRAEQIHITIDTHSGMILCHVPKHLECPIIQDLQNSLNKDQSRLAAIMTQLRYWITFQRCQKTLQHLPATAVQNLSFIKTPDHPILKPGRHRVFVKLHRHTNVVLVVHLQEKPKMPNEMEYTFYFGIVQYQDMDINYDDSNNQSQILSSLEGSEYSLSIMDNGENSNIFVSKIQLIEFDAFIATHGPGTNVDYVAPHKRKTGGEMGYPPTKQTKAIYPAYFIPDLAHVVAMCDEKIPFLNLAVYLSKYGIPHCGMQVEPNAISLKLKILCFPKPRRYAIREDYYPIVTSKVWADFKSRILSISIRSQMNKNNQIRAWVLEIIFHDTPFSGSNNPAEHSQRKTLYLTYEQTNNYCQTVEDILTDWAKIVYLYILVYDFANSMKKKRSNISDMVSINSYNYLNLIIGYGPKKEVLCNIFWSSQKCHFNIIFLGGITAINAHSVMRDEFVNHLNFHQNLSEIVQLLQETYNPLSSVVKLSNTPHLGTPRPQVPVLTFCVFAQSTSVVRLVYQSVYCLEICFRGGRLVAIRDGSYSRFDRNLIEEFNPIQGLKGFLAKYVDEDAICRSMPQNEDDNPPSPIGLEDNYSGGLTAVSVSGAGSSSPFPAVGLRGPQSPRDCGIRFPAPHTASSSSNPHTPASPHYSSSSVSSSGPVGSLQSHSSYNLTSPPSSLLPHPSPGGLLPSSPLNPQPSPHMVHSPGPNTLYMQGHQDSPFTAMSPANSNWPGSPNMARPSSRPGQSPEHKPVGQTDHRSSNQNTSGTNSQCTLRIPSANRSWAGAIPTIITHEKFDLLCRPSPHPSKDVCFTVDISPLERFLGCIYIRRQLQRNVQTDESLIPLNSNEPGIIMFKVENLQCQVFLNHIHMQSLHLKITQLPPSQSPENKQLIQLSPDDISIIEQFFDTRVVAPPYRPNSLHGFCRVLTCAPQVLRDFVQIMRLELKPDLVGDQFKWMVQFCMRVPPSAVPIVPIGSPGVLIVRLKILFFLQITRIPYTGKEWKDSPTLVLPMVYDLNSNITQLAEKREQPQSPSALAASSLLRRFSEYSTQQGQCSLFPAVREILVNLQLPNDVPTSNQPIVTPVGSMVGTTPNSMMHTSMQQISSNMVGPQVAPSYTPMPQNPGPQ